MASVNKAFIIARVGKRPELRSTGSGKPVCNFSVAVNDRGKDMPPTWLDIVAWDKVADSCSKYLDKGSLVAIDGRIQVREYEKDGQKRKAWEIVAFSVTFLDTKPKSESREREPGEDDDFGDRPSRGSRSDSFNVEEEF